MKLAAVLGTLVMLVPAAAQAKKLGGISADSAHVLVDKDTVCTPAAASADGSVGAAPVCAQETDKKALKAYKWKPGGKLATKTADGALKLEAHVAEDHFVQVIGADKAAEKTTLVMWDAGKSLALVKGPFLSADGNTVVVEYTFVNDDGSKGTDVAAFDIKAPLGKAAGPAGGVADRVLQHKGRWKQALVACDTAGVSMALLRDHSFAIATETKCQGQRDHLVVDGTWTVEEPDTLVLTFDNMNASDEVTKVKIGKCPDTTPDATEECLTWSEDDVQFVLRASK